jgi:hypothetical protein
MKSVTSNKQLTVCLRKSEIHKAVSPVHCPHLGQQDRTLSNYSTYLSEPTQGPCPCRPSVTVFHVNESFSTIICAHVFHLVLLTSLFTQAQQE